MLAHALFGVLDDLLLVGRRDQVVGGEAQAAVRARAETDAVHGVQEVDRLPPAEDLVAVGNHFGQVLGAQGHVVEGHAPGQPGVEHHAADGGLDERAGLGRGVALDEAAFGQADLDGGVGGHLAQRVGELHLLERRELHAVALALRAATAVM